MLVKQLSVFLENKLGRLAKVTRILGEKNIDISALSIADTTDFGILRLIVNKPEEAEKILQENNFAVNCTNVIAISVADEPGGLAKVLQILDNAAIGIEYMYAFVGKNKDEALVILRVESPVKATEVLERNKIRVLTANEVYNL
ncbi:MAG: ACT domain-containing protein [Desulfitobacteriaceae bacterium]|nr:ACT domain-containing protein [Desulfitobacteriaceae bacterium]MDD4346178.1 ACT domain-containing protein [Desulfitobacteriaceae bacterium]MDD4400881.1 ACT domain-containing protein [Desulfitobacteriaceae bacterium]